VENSGQQGELDLVDSGGLRRSGLGRPVMALGPGKYDEETTLLREKTEAKGVVLLIFNGKKGSGFSCQAPLELQLRLPAILREMAEEIEKNGLAL
jgi:hypothetical protein